MVTDCRVKAQREGAVLLPYFYDLTRFLKETDGRSNGRAPQEGECETRSRIGWRLRRKTGKERYKNGNYAVNRQYKEL